MLGFLDERGARATIFVVGELADALPRPRGAASPSLRPRSLAARPTACRARGGRAVRPLPDELRRGRAAVEDATGAAGTGASGRRSSRSHGHAVGGRRAYGSRLRVLVQRPPGSEPAARAARCSDDPFRWSNGLLELPCPLLGAGRAAVPFLGGVYFRYLPMALVLCALRHLDDDVLPWIYIHPYDIDPTSRSWCFRTPAG